MAARTDDIPTVTIGLTRKALKDILTVYRLQHRDDPGAPHLTAEIFADAPEHIQERFLMTAVRCGAHAAVTYGQYVNLDELHLDDDYLTPWLGEDYLDPKDATDEELAEMGFDTKFKPKPALPRHRRKIPQNWRQIVRQATGRTSQ